MRTHLDTAALGAAFALVTVALGSAFGIRGPSVVSAAVGAALPAMFVYGIITYDGGDAGAQTSDSNSSR